MTSASRPFPLKIPFLRRRCIVVLMAICGLSVACGADPPAGPSQDFPGPTPPAPAAMTVTAVSPSAGSTGGDTPLEITGTGFQPGATATVGGVARSVVVANSTTIQFFTPARDAGQVDVVVTNPNGQAATLAAGFVYVSPESFDFNGHWEGSALAHPEAGTRFGSAHADMPIRFSIQNGRLVSVSCGTSVNLMMSPPPPVSSGQFSFVEGADMISGRIVSARGAIGTINTGPCPATRWVATKQGN